MRYAIDIRKPAFALAGLPLALLRKTLRRPERAPSVPPAPQLREAGETGARGGIEVTWARHLDEVRAAQRLRFDIFAGEMGARLKAPIPRHDIDLYDDFCEHLLVREKATQQIIGTYRLLTPAQAQRVGGFYSETEFDLTRLRSLRPRMVELGRACVHPDHRQGAVIMALWAALIQFMDRNQLDSMIGCASIPMLHEGVFSGSVAASLWRALRATHLAPIEHQVWPRLPLPVEQFDDALDVEPPALIKGYLRIGTKVLGAPAWDPDFNCADLPMLMRMGDMPARYRKRFLETHFPGA